MNTNIKVAIYSGAVPSTTFIERLIHGLATNGTQVFLFGIQNIKVSPANNIHYYTYTHKFSKLFQLIRYSFLLGVFRSADKKKLDAIISDRKKNSRLLKVKYYPVLYHRPDIFHLQWAKSIEDWIWVQEFGMQLVLSLRGTHLTISPIGDDSLRRLYLKYFPQIDGFHAVSHSMVAKANEYGAQLSKVRVVYSGLDIDYLNFLSKRSQNNPLEIISIGRSHWTKGYIHALDAMKLLKDTGIKFHYAIIGVEDDEELLFQRSQLDLENEVTFIPLLSFEAVLKLIQTSDILFLPSIEEGIANVVLEAMALWTLVISTDCGGMNEVISDGMNGFIIPTRNPEAMALALQKASQLTMEDYQKITKAARVTIEKQHNSEKMVVDMKALYQRVLNKAL